MKIERDIPYTKVKSSDLVVQRKPAGLINQLFQKASRDRLGVDKVTIGVDANAVVLRAAREETGPVYTQDLASTVKCQVVKRK